MSRWHLRSRGQHQRYVRGRPSLRRNSSRTMNSDLLLVKQKRRSRSNSSSGGASSSNSSESPRYNHNRTSSLRLPTAAAGGVATRQQQQKKYTSTNNNNTKPEKNANCYELRSSRTTTRRTTSSSTKNTNGTGNNELAVSGPLLLTAVTTEEKNTNRRSSSSRKTSTNSSTTRRTTRSDTKNNNSTAAAAAAVEKNENSTTTTTINNFKRSSSRKTTSATVSTTRRTTRSDTNNTTTNIEKNKPTDVINFQKLIIVLNGEKFDYEEQVKITAQKKSTLQRELLALSPGYSSHYNNNDDDDDGQEDGQGGGGEAVVKRRRCQTTASPLSSSSPASKRRSRCSPRNKRSVAKRKFVDDDEDNEDHKKETTTTANNVRSSKRQRMATAFYSPTVGGRRQSTVVAAQEEEILAAAVASSLAEQPIIVPIHDRKKKKTKRMYPPNEGKGVRAGRRASVTTADTTYATVDAAAVSDTTSVPAQLEEEKWPSSSSNVSHKILTEEYDKRAMAGHVDAIVWGRRLRKNDRDSSEVAAIQNIVERKLSQHYNNTIVADWEIIEDEKEYKRSLRRYSALEAQEKLNTAEELEQRLEQYWRIRQQKKKKPRAGGSHKPKNNQNSSSRGRGRGRPRRVLVEDPPTPTSPDGPSSALSDLMGRPLVFSKKKPLPVVVRTTRLLRHRRNDAPNDHHQCCHEGPNNCPLCRMVMDENGDREKAATATEHPKAAPIMIIPQIRPFDLELDTDDEAEEVDGDRTMDDATADNGDTNATHRRRTSVRRHKQVEHQADTYRALSELKHSLAFVQEYHYQQH